MSPVPGSRCGSGCRPTTPPVGRAGSAAGGAERACGTCGADHVGVDVPGRVGSDPLSGLGLDPVRVWRTGSGIRLADLDESGCPADRRVRGGLRGARDGVVSTDRPLLDILHAETLQLEHIATDLHTLTLAESDRLVLRPERVPLAGLPTAAAVGNGAAAATVGMVIEVDVPDDLAVRADPLRLRQIVDNLVANAVRHSAGTRVQVAARASGAADDVEIRVVDDGRGDDETLLPHLFERFMRADPARSRGGSGLGLAIVSELVRAHGGTVAAALAPGGGLVVTVRLPRG